MKKSKPKPKDRPFWDEDLVIPPPPNDDRLLWAIMAGILAVAMFIVGYCVARPRTIHILKTEKTKHFALIPTKDEACDVKTTPKEWMVVCGIQ